MSLTSAQKRGFLLKYPALVPRTPEYNAAIKQFRIDNNIPPPTYARTRSAGKGRGGARQAGAPVPAPTTIATARTATTRMTRQMATFQTRPQETKMVILARGDWTANTTAPTALTTATRAINATAYPTLLTETAAFESKRIHSITLEMLPTAAALHTTLEVWARMIQGDTTKPVDLDHVKDHGQTVHMTSLTVRSLTFPVSAGTGSRLSKDAQAGLGPELYLIRRSAVANAAAVSNGTVVCSWRLIANVSVSGLI